MSLYFSLITLLSPKLFKTGSGHYGSRIHGTAKTYSDIDIGLVTTQPIPLVTLALLEERFSATELPYKVDLVDYQRISDSFRAIIDEDYELL